MRGQVGFSLVELIVAIAILGVIVAIAAPLYRGYVESAATGALVNNIATMDVFQEDVMLRTGTYAEGTYDAGAGKTSLTDATGWRPPVGYRRGLRRRRSHRFELSGHGDGCRGPSGLPDHAGADAVLNVRVLPGTSSMRTVLMSGIGERNDVE